MATLVIAGITLTSAVHFLATQAHLQRRNGLRLEAQQAMRSSLDAITRDLRLAGACLPIDGQFVALTGVNAPGGDALTIRTGLVRTNMSCIVSSTTALAPAGSATLQVASANGFTTDMLGYVRHPNGSGEILPISGAGGTAVSFGTGLSQDYPVGSGVYAIDERTYAVDHANPDLPLLTLTVNRGLPQAFAGGMRDLQIEYVLDRNCPPCDRVGVPTDTAEWRLVNSIDLTGTVDTIGSELPEDQATFVATSAAKPRNLLP